ncbi:MAG: hypothetical protein K0S97_1496 [Chloroflexota bacterium]|jgi:hypothetical protein|nr:hypothetical protein [Chloroflexota bacterium]
MARVTQDPRAQALGPAGKSPAALYLGGLVMKGIVPVVLSVVLSLIATFIAVAATRLIARHNVRIDAEELPDAA